MNLICVSSVTFPSYRIWYETTLWGNTGAATGKSMGRSRKSVCVIHWASRCHLPARPQPFYSSPVWQVHLLGDSLGHGHCSHAPRLRDPDGAAGTNGVRKRKGWVVSIKQRSTPKNDKGISHHGSRLSGTIHTVSLLVIVRIKTQKGRSGIPFYVYWSEDARITAMFFPKCCLCNSTCCIENPIPTWHIQLHRGTEALVWFCRFPSLHIWSQWDSH